VRALLTRLAVALAVLASLGCGSESTPNGTPATQDAVATTPGEPQPRSDVLRCTEPPDALVTAIASSLTVAGGATLRDAKAVVGSANVPLVVFVSAEVDGKGIAGDGEIGTWTLTIEEDGYGRVYAVGGSAGALSHWAGPRSTFSMEAEGAKVSVGCVRSG
jgi:hypothetical protein